MTKKDMFFRRKCLRGSLGGDVMSILVKPLIYHLYVKCNDTILTKEVILTF